MKFLGSPEKSSLIFSLLTLLRPLVGLWGSLAAPPWKIRKQGFGIETWTPMNWYLWSIHTTNDICFVNVAQSHSMQIPRSIHSSTAALLRQFRSISAKSLALQVVWLVLRTSRRQGSYFRFWGASSVTKACINILLSAQYSVHPGV